MNKFLINGKIILKQISLDDDSIIKTCDLLNKKNSQFAHDVSVIKYGSIKPKPYKKIIRIYNNDNTLHQQQNYYKLFSCIYNYNTVNDSIVNYLKSINYNFNNFRYNNQKMNLKPSKKWLQIDTFLENDIIYVFGLENL